MRRFGVGDVVSFNGKLEEKAARLVAVLLATKPEDLTPFGRRFVERLLAE